LCFCAAQHCLASGIEQWCWSEYACLPSRRVCARLGEHAQRTAQLLRRAAAPRTHHEHFKSHTQLAVMPESRACPDAPLYSLVRTACVPMRCTRAQRTFPLVYTCKACRPPQKLHAHTQPHTTTRTHAHTRARIHSSLSSPSCTPTHIHARMRTQRASSLSHVCSQQPAPPASTAASARLLLVTLLAGAALLALRTCCGWGAAPVQPRASAAAAAYTAVT